MKINYGTPGYEDKADLIITSDTISLAQAVVIAIVQMAKLDAIPGTIPNMEVWLTEVDATDLRNTDFIMPLSSAIHIVDIDGEYDDNWPMSIVKTVWEMLGHHAVFNILRYGKVSHSEAVVRRILPTIADRMTAFMKNFDWAIQTDLHFWIRGQSDKNSMFRNPETMAVMVDYVINIITDKVLQIKDETVW